LARRALGLPSTFPPAHVPAELAAQIIPFDSGFAFPHLLPDLTRFAVDALEAHRQETLQYGVGQGHPPLRTWIAGYMNGDGCSVSAANILIVNGAKGGLDLICRLLIDEGDAVVVAVPVYFTAIPLFRNFGVEFIQAEQDGEGIDVEALERQLQQRARQGLPQPKFIYDVADFHNPSGLTLSAARRTALVQLATRRGIYLVEDNPYRRVRFEGQSLPTLKSLDTDGSTVIHVGTFSKLIAPGLRLGWVAAEESLVARMIRLKSDGGCSPFLQRMVLGFCSSPDFQDHVHRVQSTYREHRDRMVTAIRRELPGVEIVIPQGGYYLWLTLPESVDSDVFARRAEDTAVHIIPGSKFFPNADPQTLARAKRHLRLSYSFATLEQIDEGLRRLAPIYRSLAAVCRHAAAGYRARACGRVRRIPQRQQELRREAAGR